MGTEMGVRTRSCQAPRRQRHRMRGGSYLQPYPMTWPRLGSSPASNEWHPLGTTSRSERTSASREQPPWPWSHRQRQACRVSSLRALGGTYPLCSRRQNAALLQQTQRSSSSSSSSSSGGGGGSKGGGNSGDSGGNGGNGGGGGSGGSAPGPPRAAWPCPPTSTAAQGRS
jgi:hypothetical protein